MGKNKEKNAAMKKAYKEKMKSKAKERKLNLKEKRARLIVKNLPFAATEANLRTHFEKFGKVANVQLLKKEDGKLVGCGFIQFDAVQKAAKAKHHLNGKDFLGRIVECDFAIPKKQFEKKVRQEKRKHFLEELRIKEEPIDLDNIKEEIDGGEDNDVVEIKKDVDVNKDDDSESDADKKKADSEGDEEIEDDKQSEEGLENAQDVDSGVDDQDDGESSQTSNIAKKPRFESHDTNEQKTIFVKNLPFDATNNDFRECMNQFGPVYYALVCVDKMTEHSKGTGFVKFRYKEDADRCLQAGTELTLMGTILDCHLAIDRHEMANKSKEKDNQKQKDSRNLYLIKEGVILAGTKAAEGVSASDMAKRLQLEQYKTQMLRNLNMFISKTRLIIHNLPETWDDNKLRTLLQKHAGSGAITKESRVMRNMRNLDSKGVGASKEYGFVTFTTHEHALNALRSLNNNPLVFSESKRPIVAFSIENRVMLNTKIKRMEKSRQMNPLTKPDSKKDYQNSKQKKQQKSKYTVVIEGADYSGIKGKPGQKLKMRSRYKLSNQVQIHQEHLKEQKRKQKNATKTLNQKRQEFIRQDGQKINKNKRSKGTMDDNFSKMVNDYKSKLMKVNKNNDSSSIQMRGKWAD